MKLRILTAACLAALCLCLPAAAAGETLPETAPPEAGETVTVQCQAELFQEGSLAGEYSLPGTMVLADGQEEALYQVIYEGMNRAEETIDLSALGIRLEVIQSSIDPDCEGAQLLKRTFEAVINDHPELFFATGWWSYRASYSRPEGYYIASQLTPQYDAELLARRDAFNSRVEEVLALAGGLEDPLEIALFFHDWLAANNAYSPYSEMDTTSAHSAYGALVDGQSVCQGYALAYKLLLDRTGVECVTVTSDDLNHMWNAVCLDGQWYYVDVTWDDPVADRLGRCLHDNFLLSESGLRATGHDSTDWTFNPDNDNSVIYESGWAFNDGADTPFYLWNGRWYYVKNHTYERNGNTYIDYAALHVQDTLAGSGDELVKFDNEAVYSAAWDGGWGYCLGYFGSQVTQMELAGGQTRTLGEQEDIPYNCGLRCDRAAGTLQVLTDLDRTTGERTAVASFLIRDYPVDWDSVPTGTTALAGAVENEAGGLRIGLMWAEGSEAPAPWLAAAFYDGGRLAALRTVKLQGLEDGLNVLDLDGLPGGYTRAALFLLDGDGTLTPLARKLSLENGGA